MIQRRDTAGLRLRDLLSPLALVAALMLAGPACAAAPPPRPAMPVQPLFVDPDIHTDPIRMATAVVGASAAPTTGRYGALVAVYFAEHPHVKAWRLHTPLTEKYSRLAIGTTTLVLNGFGSTLGGLDAALGQLGTLKVGEHYGCWPLQDTDIFHPLPSRWLRIITDGQIQGEGTAEAEIYSRILVRANYTSDKAFRSAVRSDLTLAHMVEDPDYARGHVVRIHGKLQKINRYPPTYDASQGGVHDLFEAWISNGSQPYRVQFTEWPQGLSKKLLGKEKIDEHIIVVADGYFFKLIKRFSLKINNRSAERDVPVLIGHTIRVPTEQELAEQVGSKGPGWVKSLVFGIVAVVAALMFSVIGLTYWYRRSDNNIRRRLMQARAPEFILPPPDAMPIAPMASPIRPFDGPDIRPHLNPPLGPLDRLGDRPREPGGGDSPERPPEEGAGS